MGSRRFAALVRPLGWLLASSAALAFFVIAERWSTSPLRLQDLGGWLGEADRTDAIVEIARWLGVALAGYVALIAALAFLAEIAAALRLVSLSRLFARIGRGSAVPLLRDRLWRAATGVAISASTIAVSPSGLATASGMPVIEHVVDVPGTGTQPAMAMQSRGSIGEFSGFGYGPATDLADVLPRPHSRQDDVVTVVVVEGDTVWDLAEAHYGYVDSRVVERVAAANDLRDPSLILVGQRLVFPVLNEIGGSSSAYEPASGPTHRVVAGDSLWEILDDHYGYVDAELVERVAGANGVSDPSLIRVDQILVLPTPDRIVEPSRVPPTPQPDVMATDDQIPGTGELADESAIPRSGPIIPEDDRQDLTVTIAAPPPAASSANASSHLPATTITPDGVDGEDVPFGGPESAEPSGDSEVVAGFHTAPRTLWWTLPSGTLLLGGLALTASKFRRRRRAAGRPRDRAAQPSTAAAGTELAAMTRSAGDRLSTLRGLLEGLTPHLRGAEPFQPVRAVQIDDDRVEVLFSDPAAELPPGWTTVDGGLSWSHALEPGQELSQQLVTPALVTIGARHGERAGEVLLDLESAGTLAIAGNREAALGLARSMVLELATYPLGVAMDVGLIGLVVPGAEHCDRTWIDTSLERAVDVCRRRVEDYANSGGIVGARAQLDEDDGGHDPHVFVVDRWSIRDDELLLLDELVLACAPCSGIAIVVVGDQLGVSERIDVAEDGAIWSGVDLALHAPHVSVAAAEQAADLLDHAANAELAEDAAPESSQAAVVGGSGVSAAVAQDDPGGAAEYDIEPLEPFVYEPPAYDVLVRVIGNVRIEGIDCRSADEEELLAVLTCLRDRSLHIDLIQDNVAPEGAKRTIQNRLSSLRRRLGVGSDGQDLLPECARGGGNQGTYRVSDLVLTDVDLLEHRFETAKQLGSFDMFVVLRDGLDLMEGPLFRARKGYSWATAEGYHARAAQLVIDYATMLMELAMERDDIALVLRTAAVASRVVDDPMMEVPMRRLETDYAEASGHPDLVQSVATARQRLLEYVQCEDSLASG